MHLNAQAGLLMSCPGALVMERIASRVGNTGKSLSSMSCNLDEIKHAWLRSVLGHVISTVPGSAVATLSAFGFSRPRLVAFYFPEAVMPWWPESGALAHWRTPELLPRLQVPILSVAGSS